MIESLSGQTFLQFFIDQQPLSAWVTDRQVIFLLVQKKENQSIAKLLRTGFLSVDQVDKKGNDLLLHLS